MVKVRAVELRRGWWRPGGQRGKRWECRQVVHGNPQPTHTLCQPTSHILPPPTRNPCPTSINPQPMPCLHRLTLNPHPASTDPQPVPYPHHCPTTLRREQRAAHSCASHTLPCPHTLPHCPSPTTPQARAARRPPAARRGQPQQRAAPRPGRDQPHRRRVRGADDGAQHHHPRGQGHAEAAQDGGGAWTGRCVCIPVHAKGTRAMLRRLKAGEVHRASVCGVRCTVPCIRAEHVAASKLDSTRLALGISYPVVCTLACHQPSALFRPQVMVRTWPNPVIPKQYFRVMDTEVPLCCGPCGHFFEQDEYEMVSAASGTGRAQAWWGVPDRRCGQFVGPVAMCICSRVQDDETRVCLISILLAAASRVTHCLLSPLPSRPRWSAAPRPSAAPQCAPRAWRQGRRETRTGGARPGAARWRARRGRCWAGRWGRWRPGRRRAGRRRRARGPAARG